jgi:hypothetical protein
MINCEMCSGNSVKRESEGATMRTAIVFALWLGVCASARADVKFENGEPVTLKKIRELRESRKEALTDYWAWAAYEGFQPLERPDEKSPPAGAADLKLKFLTRVNKLYDYQHGDNYCLVGEGELGSAKFKILGWVPKRYMVLDHRAFQDRGSTLLHRAMIVNTVRYVKEEKVVEPPAMLLAPAANARADATLRLFNVYFVYGDSQPRTNAQEEEQGYLLLGARTQFDYETAVQDGVEGAEEPRRVILGWVDKRRICRWRTTEAIRWDTESKRGAPVITYETEDEARKAIRNPAFAKMVTSELFVEGKPPAWKSDRMRYPVLPIDKDEKTGADILESPSQGNILRKIGLVGGFVNEKGEMEADVAELEELDSKLKKLQQESQTLELLFVVDDSESMDEWFPRTAETIQELIKMVKGDERTLRLGLTYYSDVPFDERDTLGKLKKAVITSGQLADSKSPKVAAILDELPRHKTRRGYDPPEQVFLGLRMGIDEAGFTPFARKIVILIGDTGDHDTNADGSFKAEKNIVKWLTPKDQSPIEFYALQVSERLGTDELTYKQQTKSIVKMFEDATFDKKTGKSRPAGYYPITDKAQLKKVILERFKQLQDEAKKTQTLMDRIRMGQFELIDKLDGEFIKALNIPADRLDRFKKSKGAQLFSYAYVWEKNTQLEQQTRRQLLVSARELKALHSMLGDLVFPNADATYVPKPGDLGKLVIKLQEGLDDQDALPGNPRARSIEAVMKVKFGFHFRSPLLQLTVDQLEKNPPKDEKYLRQQLKKKYYLIDDILKNRKHRYEKMDEFDRVEYKRTVEITPRWPEEFNRSFTLHKGKEASWYWLDYDTEWP